MANILQVTTPELKPEYGRYPSDGQADGRQVAGLKVQNPVDPSRVVRADGQEKMGAGSQEQGFYGVVDYDSNYGAFLKQLAQNSAVSSFLEGIFSGKTQFFARTGQTEMAKLAQYLLDSMSADSPEALAGLLKEAVSQQVLFAGPFFERLRALLGQRQPSEETLNRIGQFLKSYSAGVSGEHLLRQMFLLTRDIEILLHRQYKEDFRQLADMMDWGAKNGDVAHNTQVLNNNLLPFLASYISSSHDYGPVREAVMLLIYYAARYESGGSDQIETLFQRLANSNLFAGEMSPEEAEMEMRKLMDSLGNRTEGKENSLLSFLAEGAKGGAGSESVQQYYNALNSLLLNQSVYMPLLHLFLPFQFQENHGTMEAWIDPDAEGNENGARGTKLFFKFSVETLGHFEMILFYNEGTAKIQMKVPDSLAASAERIGGDVKDILKKNGIACRQISVGSLTAETRLEEVFPELARRGGGINVRV